MDILIIYALTSLALGLPPGVLRATCYVESNHNVAIVNSHDGGSPSIGACQIKLATARLLGFEGDAATLQKPEVNTYYAGLYLRRNLFRYHGDVRKAVCAYNAGSCRLALDGTPKNAQYVSRVFKAWSEGK